MTALGSEARPRFAPPGLPDEILPPREREYCAVCGRVLTPEAAHGLCHGCERAAALRLRELLRSMEPEELAYLDWSVEGVSLFDFADGEM